MELPQIALTRLLDLHPALNDLRCRKALELADIAVIDEHIPYDEFYMDYIVANRPVLLRPWATHNWPCRNLWFESNGDIQWGRLIEHFGRLLNWL